MSDKTTTTKHTLVEEGTELAGTIRSTVPIVVMGKVEGDITGPEIHVSAQGVVAGKVKVQRLHSEGEIAGEVEADSVKISGRVRDRTVIRAKSLEVALVSSGMQVQFGDCELAVGEAPDKDAAIAAATAKDAPATKDAPVAAKDDAVPAHTAEVSAPTPVALPGLATGTGAVEPSKADAKSAKDRKPRPSEMAWDEASKTAAKPDAPDEEPKRKRGTLPPPS
jgi:cytoskeletal protein CcmA (bactofilin family)